MYDFRTSKSSSPVIIKLAEIKSASCKILLSSISRQTSGIFIVGFLITDFVVIKDITSEILSSGISNLSLNFSSNSLTQVSHLQK